MRAFGIHHLPVDGRPNCVRFIGSPYNAFVEDCRSMQVNAHSRGRTSRGECPLVVKALLVKFEINEQDFLGELNRDTKPKPELPKEPRNNQGKEAPPLVN